MGDLVADDHPDGSVVEISGPAAFEERWLKIFLLKIFCNFATPLLACRMPAGKVMVLWFGEYQAFTIAGCISQISLLGSSRRVMMSCLAAQPFMFSTFVKKGPSTLVSLVVGETLKLC